MVVYRTLYKRLAIDDNTKFFSLQVVLAMAVGLEHCGRVKSSSSVSLTGRLRGSKGGGLSTSSHRRSLGFSSGCSKKAVVRSYTRNLCSSV